MVSMNILNEAEILQNIEFRYKKDLIFTYIGPTLIVVNPYKILNDSFSDNNIKYFKNVITKNVVINLSEHLPHIWSLSSNAYLKLF